MGQGDGGRSTRRPSGLGVTGLEQLPIHAAGISDHVLVRAVVAGPAADGAAVDPNETKVAIVGVDVVDLERDGLAVVGEGVSHESVWWLPMR